MEANQIRKDSNVLYLTPPHARLIWEGEKILILKKRKYENMLNKELFLASEDKIWGKITLTSVFPLTREQVEATEFAHRVSLEERKKWWNDPPILYAYTFTFKKYEKPQPKKLPVGIQTFFVLKREKDIMIEFLGTGAESKWKEEITVDGKPRKYTSTLINNSILINVTPDHEKWFKQHENQLKGILFSHAHKDALAGWFKQYRTKVPIYVTEELTKAENFHLSSKYKIVPEKKAFEIDGIKFVYHPVKHAKNTSTYAIEIDDQIIHSEDVLDFPNPEILRNKKLWIADGSSLKRRIERDGMGHMSMFEAIELASKYNVNRVVFTQIGHSRGLSHEELHEELHKFANKHYPNVRHISIAKEGLRHHLKSDVITKRAFISTLNKPGWRIFEPEEFFDIKQISFPVAVKEKIDGMRLQVHVKDGKLQHLFSDEGHDVKDQFKCMADDFRKYPDGVYDAEGIMLTSEGKPMHRTAFIGYAKSKTFDLDKCKRSRIRIFDVLFFKGKDVRDLTHQERLKIAHSLPKLTFVKPEITGKLRQKNVQGFIVNSRKEYLEAVKRVREVEGSEGAMIIQLDSKYRKDTKHNPQWVKLKNLKEVDCLVAEVFPIEGTKNVFGYRICAGPYSKECGEIVKKRRPKKAYEYKGEIYAVLGKTFNTKIRVPKHHVLRIKCDEILRDRIEGTNCFVYSAVKPLVIEYVKERNDVPDSIHVLDRLAELSLPRMKGEWSIEKFVRRRGDSWCVLDSEGEPIKCYSIREFGEEGAKEKANRLHRAIMASKARRGKIKKVEELTPELYRELAKEGEPLPEKYYKFHPDCKPCRWVLQKHEPGRKVEVGPEKPLIEEEVRKEVLESELFQNLVSKSLTEYAINGDIILKFRDHLDLRVQIGKNKAVGWALHPPQNVPGGVVGEFIRRLKSHKQTQSAAKLLMEGRALNWLDVGKKGRVEIPAGKPGASRVRTAFIEAIDWGTVKFGIQRRDMHEYFFRSKKGILEGRFIARVLKVGENLNWYLMKPENQLPLNPQVHKDEGYPYVILNEDLTEEILEKD